MPLPEDPPPTESRRDGEPTPIGPDVERLLQRYRRRLQSEPEEQAGDVSQGSRDAGHSEARERPLANVELGDIVKLRTPYAVGSKLYGQEGAVFTHGIVAEILSRLPDGRTRSVSLYLYSADTRHIYLGPNGIVEFVDHHCSEFALYKRATEMGYLPTDPNAPPDADGA